MGTKSEKLSKQERLRLYDLKGKGQGIRAIARELMRSASTISRELERNQDIIDRVGYTDIYQLAEESHKAAIDRRKIASSRPRLKNETIRQFVKEELKDKRPPWQIAERLKEKHRGCSISAQAIYDWIKTEAPELRCYLVRTKKRWQFKGPRRGKFIRKPREPKVCIDKRPKIISRRKRYGDWEGDTVVSKQSKNCLLTLVERKSRFTIIVKLPRCTKELVKNAIIASLKEYPPQLRKSITLDNGPENFEYEEVSKALNADVFFCHPYSSYERGSNENTNGFVRRYFPKQTDFRNVSQEDAAYVQHLRNSGPMKCLNKKTPASLFLAVLHRYRKQNL